ncbi:MAG TPA: lytic murein transglycosylase B [Gammaproteobacteria bacterium]|nr:lytic murein transglycosylase B [Gammaproteobacteria bacterium]
MVDEHGFQRQAVKSVLAQAKIKPVIIEKMTRPAEAFPWHRYRNIFLKPKRISQGIAFWLQYAALLKEAEKTYGVPAEIIVAILGVETRFGRIKGGFRLVDSLTTIAVDYPKRRQYFLKELEQAFLLAREENFDLLSLVGSYAGAMGMAQFMPSSYRHYAVDGDNDGVRDLLHNPADAVGSIANYLKLHHWKPGEPIATRATVVGTKYRQFIKKGMKPSVRIHDIGRYQVTAEKNYSKKLKASLIALEQQHGFEYWLGLNNFYSITRYNHSNLYAMAVYQLAEEIRAGYQLVRKI